MELRPGAHFEIEGKGFEYVGVQKNSTDTQSVQVVAKVESTLHDEALHQVMSLQELEERGSNFWNFGETLKYSEFTKQYGERVNSLRNTGILEELSSGLEGVIGFEGKEYPVPSLELIRKSITDKSTEYSIKMEQGFTRLQLTPIAVPISLLSRRVSESIFHHKLKGNIFHLKLDPSDPDISVKVSTVEPVGLSQVLTDEEKMGTIVYFPSLFSDQNHHGLSKEQVVKDPTYCLVPGWSVSLIEENAFLPVYGASEIVGGRRRLDNNLIALDYLAILKNPELLNDQSYAHETGFTPEDFLIDFLTRLEETNQISYDEIQANRSWLLGSYLVKSQTIPYGLWHNSNKRLEVKTVSGYFSNTGQGAKTAVRLGR